MLHQHLQWERVRPSPRRMLPIGLFGQRQAMMTTGISVEQYEWWLSYGNVKVPDLLIAYNLDWHWLTCSFCAS